MSKKEFNRHYGIYRSLRNAAFLPHLNKGAESILMDAMIRYSVQHLPGMRAIIVQFDSLRWKVCKGYARKMQVKPLLPVDIKPLPRLFLGEDDEIVTVADIRALYETAKAEGWLNDPAETFEEYFQDVTDKGGYYQELITVESLHCHDIIREMFVPDDLTSVNELPETFSGVRLVESDFGWFIIGGGYVDAVRVIDIDNLTVRY